MMNLRLTYQGSQNKEYLRQLNEYFVEQDRPVYFSFNQKITELQVKEIFNEYFSDFPEHSLFIPQQIRQSNKETQVSFRCLDEKRHKEILSILSNLSPQSLYEYITGQVKQFSSSLDISTLLSFQGNALNSAQAFTYGLHQKNIPATVVTIGYQNIDIFAVVSIINRQYQLSIPYLDSIQINSQQQQGFFMVQNLLQQFIHQNMFQWKSDQFQVSQFIGYNSPIVTNQLLIQNEDVYKINYQCNTTLLIFPKIRDQIKQIIKDIQYAAYQQYKKQDQLFELQSYSVKNYYLQLVFVQQSVQFFDANNINIDFNSQRPIVSENHTAKNIIMQQLQNYDAKYQTNSALKWQDSGFYFVFNVTINKIISKGTCRITNGFRYYTQFLSKNQVNILNLIISSAITITPQIKIPLNLKVVENDLKILQKVIQLDYPELFYIYISKFEIQNNCITSIEIIKNQNSNIEQTQKHLFSIADTLIQQFKQQKFQFSEFFQNFIHKNVQYNERNIERSSQLLYEHSVIGCLIDRKCVCQGIACAYKFLCDILGLKTIQVIGFGGSRPHSWIIQEINKNYYNIDFTWNLTSQTNLYLNAPDILLHDHVRDNEFNLPDCNQFKEYYYQKMGYFCKDLSVVKQIILKQLNNEYIQLIFDKQIPNISILIQEMLCEISFDIHKVISAVTIQNISKIMYKFTIEVEDCSIFKGGIKIGKYLAKGNAKEEIKNIRGINKVKYVQIGQYFKFEIS
ncbi:Transglutaminase-like superfamily protein [Spironucleus salmonicida]|uniref:Transglutaminase-like superfamily protein n=1 Tax=Spironucleus salmonicida TaxID=348837 RepID=V6LU56_9EUKA|nr:Transglutaminase-like superfamily protein [Spironucleus salmonicida]|eukprot:EST47778.1 Transglutaminase-like superfamily protein [Spironucleus salmonicida]